jgi:hypothetical protein
MAVEAPAVVVPVKAVVAPVLPVVTAPVVAPVEVEYEHEISLDDFCRNFSLSEKRVELISGFHMQMRIDAKPFATQAAYKALFEAFINAPA